MIEGMILTVLGGLLSSALSGVVGNRADAAVYNAWRFIGKRLRDNNDKPINHDIQRAVVRSYINALNLICDECLQELKLNKKGYSIEIKTLEDKKVELNGKLKEIEKAEHIASPLEDLDEIELLLTSEGTLAREQIEIIKQKLIKASVGTKNVPVCFREKMEKPNAGLFELMSLFFAKEIKQNQVVRNIFESQLLSKIDVKLNGQLLTVDLLERSLIDVASEVSKVLSITARTETKVDEIKILLSGKAKKEPPKIPVEIKSLLDEAASAIDQGYYEKGRDVSQKALELAKKTDNKVAIGKSIFLLAEVLHKCDKEYTSAIRLLNESLECFKYAESEYDIANVLFELGVIEITEGRFDEASAFITQAMEIDKRNDEKNRIAQALHQLGWIEYHRGQTKEAIELYDEAIKYFFSSNNDSDTEVRKSAAGIAGCYHHKGLIFESEGRIIDAESSFIKALDWHRKTDLKPEIGKTIYLLSALKYRKAEYEAADLFLDEAIELYSELGDHSMLSRCYQLKGQVNFTLNKRDKAIELFLIALEMANKSKDIKQQLNVLRTLGNAYFNRKLPEEAKKCFEKARDLSLTNGLLEEYAVSLKGFASFEKNKEEKDKLLKEGIKVLEKILHNIQAYPKRAQISGSIGSIYENLEDFKQALFWYQSEKTTYESINNILGIANAMGSIARIKYKLGKKKEAFNIFLSLKELLIGTSFNDLMAGTLINLGIFYEEQGDLNEAKNAFEEAEYLSNKYSLEHLLHVRDLLEKLNARMEWRKPDEMSYEQLVRELFELVDWFPEAKNSILRFWFSSRIESIRGNICKNSGVKFMICTDNLMVFQDLVNKLHPFSDLFLQVVSEDEYPTEVIDNIPIPAAKIKVFDYMFGIRSPYRETSSSATSKITGNIGVVITGISLGLPEQAHQLLLSTTADDLLNKKIFFLPDDRFSENEKLETYVDLGVELGIIPLFLNTLPDSDSVNVLMSKDIKLPILSHEKSTELKKQIRKLKHSILQLNTLPKDRVQSLFNDFIFDIENLADDYDGEDFLQMKVYVLETINSLDNFIFTAFVTSTTE